MILLTSSVRTKHCNNYKTYSFASITTPWNNNFRYGIVLMHKSEEKKFKVEREKYCDINWGKFEGYKWKWTNDFNIV